MFIPWSSVGALTCPGPVHELLHWYERKEQIHYMSVNRIICWYVLSAYPSWSHPNYHYLGFFLGACKSNQDYQNVIILFLRLGSLIQKRRNVGSKVNWLFISIHPNWIFVSGIISGKLALAARFLQRTLWGVPAKVFRFDRTLLKMLVSGWVHSNVAAIFSNYILIKRKQHWSFKCIFV